MDDASSALPPPLVDLVLRIERDRLGNVLKVKCHPSAPQTDILETVNLFAWPYPLPSVGDDSAEGSSSPTPPQAPTTRSHTFVLQDNLGAARYGVCARAPRMVRSRGKATRTMQASLDGASGSAHAGVVGEAAGQDGGGEAEWVARGEVALCIVSRWPFLAFFDRLVRTLTDAVAGDEIDIIPAVYSLIYQVPVPPSGARVTIDLGSWAEPVTLRALSWRRCDLAMESPLRCLGVGSLATLLACLLLERPTLVVSDDVSTLVPFTEAVLAMLLPLRWQMVYIPLLPSNLIDFIEAPTQFLLGARAIDGLEVLARNDPVAGFPRGASGADLSGLASPDASASAFDDHPVLRVGAGGAGGGGGGLRDEICVVDLDAAAVRPPADFLDLPRDLRRRFCDALRLADSDGSPPERENLIASAGLALVAAVCAGFPEFVQSDGGFDRESWLASLPPSRSPFAAAFADTGMFAELVGSVDRGGDGSQHPRAKAFLGLVAATARDETSVWATVAAGTGHGEPHDVAEICVASPRKFQADPASYYEAQVAALTEAGPGVAAVPAESHTPTAPLELFATLRSDRLLPGANSMAERMAVLAARARLRSNARCLTQYGDYQILADAFCAAGGDPGLSGGRWDGSDAPVTVGELEGLARFLDADTRASLLERYEDSNDWLATILAPDAGADDQAGGGSVGGRSLDASTGGDSVAGTDDTDSMAEGWVAFSAPIRAAAPGSHVLNELVVAEEVIAGESLVGGAASDLAIQLLETITGLFKGLCAPTPDGDLVLTEPSLLDEIRTEPRYSQYCGLASRLVGIDAVSLSHRERLCVFVNVYNALNMHASVAFGVPSGLLGRLAWSKAAYNIGGHRYTLAEIEHAVLRAASVRPSMRAAALFCPGPFSEDDPRAAAALSTRTQFLDAVLSHGTLSSPPVVVLRPATVSEQMAAAFSRFVETHAVVNEDRRRVTLPKVFDWFQRDYAKSKMGMLRLLAQSCGAESALRRLVQTADRHGHRLSVKFAKYSWDFGYVFPSAIFLPEEPPQEARVFRRRGSIVVASTLMDGSDAANPLLFLHSQSAPVIPSDVLADVAEDAGGGSGAIGSDGGDERV